MINRWNHLVHRPKPCDNVYCGYGQCREGICECHGGYTGSRCDIPRKFIQKEKIIELFGFLFFSSIS
jgi:hypothetical protein